MDHRAVGFTYNVYTGLPDLPAGDQDLIKAAIGACSHAYAPYSNFKVGAAILTQDDTIVIGSNQENSAFPIGQCAERVALYTLAHVHGRKAIDTIAIVVENEHQLTPATPCGSCRQLLTEYSSYQTKPIRLLTTLCSGGPVYEILDVVDLLPLAFDGRFLGE